MLKSYPNYKAVALSKISYCLLLHEYFSLKSKLKIKEFPSEGI